MGCMTGGTVFIDSRFMGNLGIFNDLVYVVVTFKTELAWLFLDDKGKIRGMRGVAAITFALGHWSMGPYCVTGLLN